MNARSQAIGGSGPWKDASPAGARSSAHRPAGPLDAWWADERSVRRCRHLSSVMWRQPRAKEAPKNAGVRGPREVSTSLRNPVAQAASRGGEKVLAKAQ